MNTYVDDFIKSHREYFLRNKKVITTNNWNDTESYNNNIEIFSEQLLNTENSKQKDKEKALKEIQKNIKSYTDNYKKTKEALFNQETDLTSSILSRLTSFIKETEKIGERKEEGVQKFIETTVDIIKIHIEKCNTYLNYNTDVITKNAKTEEEVDYQTYEILFQDGIFQKKIKIQEELSKLNISGEVTNSSIEFHNKKKAGFILKEPLILLREDIKELTDKIPINWDIRTSKEMYINMRPQDIPKWNKDKSYFEQDPIVLQFWAEEYNKIINGVTLGGFYMHGWLYFHLNFFRTPIPQPDGKEPNKQPPLRDNEWFFSENLKACESKDYPGYYSKAMLVYGTRRFGKSVILASLAHWRTISKFNSFGTIIGGNSSDLTSLTSKIKTSMTYIDKPLQLDVIKQEWDNGETTFGIKQDASNPVIFSTLIVQNLEAGTTKKTQKTAGLAPSVSIYDEIGKYDFLKPYLAALPSFKTPYGFKCVTCLAGTGGEASLSSDAMKVLTSPQSYDILPMDWDLLETNIDPEHITWKKRSFATFFPGQMAYEEGFIKKPQTFKSFIKNDSDELNGINIDVTNWKDNIVFLENKLLDAQKSPDSNLLVQQRRVQYPISPEDCFLSNEINPFPYEEARLHREHLMESGKWDRRRSLTKDINGVITSSINTKDLIEFPFKGGNQDAPYLIIEEPDQTKSPKFYYIASGDFYKQETTTTTDSVGTISIYKFPIFGDESGKKLVASYAARPKTYREFNDNVLLLLEYYNASFFPENEDLGVFQTYLENKHLEDVYLEKHIDFNSALSYSEGDARKYGWTPKQSKRRLIAMYATYLREPVMITNEYGEKVEVKRIQTIEDAHLLTEIINYSESGNFDRISGNIGSIGFLHFLEKNFIYPKGIKNRVSEEEPQKPKQERPRQFFSQTGRNRSFFSKRR